MIIIDANIVLRYILNDHTELSEKATKIIENQSVLLPLEVACEVVYVLQKVYLIERDQICLFLKELINQKLVIVEKSDIFIAALEYYSQTKFDFVDALLWAYSSVNKQTVLTFDKKLAKAIQKEISEK